MRTKRQPAGIPLSAFRRVPVAAAVALALSQGAMAATYTVTNSFASGPGSLAQAINDANANCGTDKAPLIQFSGPFTISQSFPLPTFTCFSPGAYTPAIDGFTNTGAVANSDPSGWNASLTVAIDGGSNFYGGSCGLAYQDFGGYGGDLTVSGIEVRNFNYGGFEAGLCGRVKVSGSSFRNNGEAGIRASSGSAIGGASAAERNFIPNNNYAGIEFDGAVSIVNNMIGVDFDGIAYESASSRGISWNCCTQPSGVISGNTIVASYVGIEYEGDDALTISGNSIGISPTGGGAMSAGGSYAISLYSSYGGTITDNVIGGFSTAIDIGYNSTVLISNNRIGVNSAGTASTDSVSTGINLYSNYGSRIEGNVISGTSDTAIYLQSSSDTVVSGNMIGTNASGSAALGNNWGLYIGFSAANNTIDGNTFGGNGTAIYSSDASYTTFSNNSIGGAVPNFSAFIAECGTNLSIVNNLISNNDYGGMDLRAIQNSVIQGNFISGNRGLDGNPAHGLTLSYTTCGGGAQSRSPGKVLTFGGESESSDNQVIGNAMTSNAGHGIFVEGGSGNAMSQNSVHGNSLDGIRIEARYDAYGAVIAPAIGNAMVGNVVYGNTYKNINLGFDGGARPNDPLDGDGGPNNGQNYPDLNPSATFYDPVSNQTTIGFLLNSKAGEYQLDFFSNPAPGAPAGTSYLGFTTVNLAADGDVIGTFTVSGMQDNTSATATRIGPEIPAVQDTSEYSPLNPTFTLPVPAVTVTPSSINFGDVVVGRSSGNSMVTVSSVGTGDYIVRALREGSCTGPAICTSGSFSCSTTCTDGSVWAPGNSCTITAAFNPSALGAQSKTLALCDDTPGSPRTITFAGNGVPPPSVDIFWTPAAWSFGEVLVGAQASSKSFTLTNAGGNVVYLGAATVSNSDFAITGNSCGATLNAGATCDANVTFIPSTKGAVSAALQIVGSNVAPTSPAALRNKVTTATSNAATAVLQGSGTQFGELRLPASMAFGTLLLHGEARHQSIELHNTGNGPITVSGITVAGPFTMTNDCGTSLAAGASCTISLNFNPATLGTANGTLNVVTDASGGSRAIALTAIVVAEARPVVRIAPTSIGFGNNQIGSDSKPQSITITNEGAEVAKLGALVVVQQEAGKNEFIVTSTTCGATLEPQASCVANIVFHALGFSGRQGELQVPSNSADSPRTATLGGTGCRPFMAGDRSGRDPCK